jgi:hypothetical protein
MRCHWRCRGKRLDELPLKNLRRDLELLVSWSQPHRLPFEWRLVTRYAPPKQKALKRVRAKGVAKTNAESWTWLLIDLLVSAPSVGCLHLLQWQN